MKRIVTCSVVAVVLFVALLSVGNPAQAGTATDVALGLASFAVFDQVAGAFARPAPVYAQPVVIAPGSVIYQPAPVVYQPAPVVYQPAPVYAPQPATVYVPAAPVVVLERTIIRYPHGHYELRTHGYKQFWVWVPAFTVRPY